MIEPCIPISFVEKVKDKLRNELEYQLFDDDDRDETLKLSHQIDALDNLIKEWMKYDERFKK